MLEGMAPGSVTVRTFDVDEDQLALRSADPTLCGGSGLSEERGAYKALRDCGLSLTRPELLRTAGRALLRAARHGSLRIMFPSCQRRAGPGSAPHRVKSRVGGSSASAAGRFSSADRP